MLQKLWRCFETTGDITTYLTFKEYENAYNNKLQTSMDTININEVG